jgi:N-acetylmuramoyl-L-alanine amidase
MKNKSPYLLILLVMIFASCSKAYHEDDPYAYMGSASKRHRTSEMKKGNGKYTVVVDAGHGAFDFGAHNKQCAEKNACLTTALFLERHLREMGYQVVLTRSSDTFIPLKDRAKFANSVHANLFVSIHYNAAKDVSASGIEVYYFGQTENERSKESKQLAQYVLNKMQTWTGAASRGVKNGNFCVIRETKMPAILVEGGFITNPKEVKLLGDRKYLDKIAFAISEGIDRYISEQKN